MRLGRIPFTRKQRLQSFWSRVDIKTNKECWNWTGGSNRGYGSFWNGRRFAYAHRLAWILKHRRIPKGLKVLHECDNSLCCNHRHLFLGTNKDNTEDMIRKGRKASTKGVNNGRAKLNEDKVRYIRRMH